MAAERLYGQDDVRAQFLVSTLLREKSSGVYCLDLYFRHILKMLTLILETF